MQLLFRSQGEPGETGAPPGNLRLRLLVKKHPIFDRRGNDLYCHIAVNEAALTEGAEVQVPTLDGSCTLLIPRGTHSGDLLRIQGRGMPDINGIDRGDIFVEAKLKQGTGKGQP